MALGQTPQIRALVAVLDLAPKVASLPAHLQLSVLTSIDAARAVLEKIFRDTDGYFIGDLIADGDKGPWRLERLYLKDDLVVMELLKIKKTGEPGAQFSTGYLGTNYTPYKA